MAVTLKNNLKREKRKKKLGFLLFSLLPLLLLLLLYSNLKSLYKTEGEKKCDVWSGNGN